MRIIFWSFLLVFSFELMANTIGKVKRIDSDWGLVIIDTNTRLYEGQKIYINDNELYVGAINNRNEASLIDNKTSSSRLKQVYKKGDQAFDKKVEVLKLTEKKSSQKKKTNNENNVEVINLYDNKSLDQMILENLNEDNNATKSNKNEVEVIKLYETPEDEFQSAFDFIRDRKWKDAEIAFEKFIKKYPDKQLSGSAHYFLGELYTLNKKDRNAALAFAEGYKKFPNSIKAPDMLYKLAISLFTLNKTSEGCQTLEKLKLEFPQSKLNLETDYYTTRYCKNETVVAKLPVLKKIEAKQMEVTVGKLNVRFEPSTNSDIHSRLTIGDIVTVIAENKDWYELENVDGTKKYASKRYLKEYVNDDLNNMLMIASKDKKELENKLQKNNKKSNRQKNQEVAQSNEPVNIIVKEDKAGPEISTSLDVVAKDLVAVIEGSIKDESAIRLVTIDGDPVPIDNNNFSKQIFVSDDNYELKIVAFDKHGNKSEVNVNVTQQITEEIINLAKLNPLSVRGKLNVNAVALIIGVEKYENTFDAQFAVNDAKVFKGFANKALGVPINNIKVLTNEEASRINTKKALLKWLPKRLKEEKTDVYLFYSGHGLASPEEQNLYLLPYEGDPEFLDYSSLTRKEIFNDINNLNPRSVTVFLDTCYSGETRDEEVLLASAKPIFIEAEEEEIPAKFTVFTASANNQIASSFKEAEHGLFSYFMMQGLEGKADTNNDKQITANELFAYLSSNVSKQAETIGREQQPQLLGGTDRIIAQW